MPFENLEKTIEALQNYNIQEEFDTIVIENEQEVLRMRNDGKTDDEIREEFVYPILKKRFTEKTGLPWFYNV